MNKVCARQCLDVVKSVERSRVDYMGTWLPEPLLTEPDDNNDSLKAIDLAGSLTTAFLLTLERLTRKERAAYLLYEIFDTPYHDVAETLDMEEAACRKLVSRAKQHLTRKHKRTSLPPEKTQLLLESFRCAIQDGDSSDLQTLLTNDVVIKADGGGKVAAIIQDVVGIESALSFICDDLHRFWNDFTFLETIINGHLGFVINEGDATHAVVSFAFSHQAAVSEIFIVRNPDKVKFLSAIPIY